MIVKLQPFANHNASQDPGVLKRNSHWRNHVIADVGQEKAERKQELEFNLVSTIGSFFMMDFFACKLNMRLYSIY